VILVKVAHGIQQSASMYINGMIIGMQKMPVTDRGSNQQILLSCRGLDLLQGSLEVLAGMRWLH
jgi:hypothetical protein